MTAQTEWPEIVEDMMFYDNTIAGAHTVRVDEIDDEGMCHLTYLRPVRSMGGWDVEEYETEKVPERVIYERLDNEAWVIESIPVGAVSRGNHR